MSGLGCTGHQCTCGAVVFDTHAAQCITWLTWQSTLLTEAVWRLSWAAGPFGEGAVPTGCSGLLEQQPASQSGSDVRRAADEKNGENEKEKDNSTQGFDEVGEVPFSETAWKEVANRDKGDIGGATASAPRASFLNPNMFEVLGVENDQEGELATNESEACDAGSRERRFVKRTWPRRKKVCEQSRKRSLKSLSSPPPHAAPPTGPAFTEMQQGGSIPDVTTYNAHINVCEKGHKVEKALALFDELQQRGLFLDVVTYNALISACERGSEKAMGALLTSISANARRSESKRADKVDQDMALVAETSGRGLEPNVITCSPLIYVERGHKLEKAMKLVAEMQQQGVIPDASTYNALISACEKSHKVDKAIELLAEMQLIGLEPNVSTYAALISACDKGHNAKKAMELFADAQRSGLIPDLISYNALISACDKGHNATMMRAFAEMQWRCLEPNVITYTANQRDAAELR